MGILKDLRNLMFSHARPVELSRVRNTDRTCRGDGRPPSSGVASAKRKKPESVIWALRRLDSASRHKIHTSQQWGDCTAMQSCNRTAGTVRRCTSRCCSVAIDPCDQTPLPQSAGCMPVLCAWAHKFQQAIPHFCSRASCKERAALSFLATLVRSLGSIPARWHDWEPGSWPEEPFVHTYWASATAPLLHLERQTSPDVSDNIVLTFSILLESWES
ncbi:hypothetical protein HBI79_157020 [Parastagonospora nodorum]|nr:hypothetical protein HBI79_157020 [Parastagonospora nodorum]